MKKILMALAVVGMLSACASADQATVDACADEICAALDGLDMEDPMSAMEAITVMAEVVQKEEYSSVGDDALQKSLEANCEAYKTLMGDAME